MCMKNNLFSSYMSDFKTKYVWAGTIRFNPVFFLAFGLTTFQFIPRSQSFPSKIPI